MKYDMEVTGCNVGTIENSDITIRFENCKNMTVIGARLVTFIDCENCVAINCDQVKETRCINTQIRECKI